MEAQLYMFPHLINDLGSLLFNKVDILILALFILLPLQLVLDLLHGVSRQISEFLLGQILYVFVIKSYFYHFFCLVLFDHLPFIPDYNSQVLLQYREFHFYTLQKIS